MRNESNVVGFARCTINRPGSSVKGLSKSIFVGTATNLSSSPRARGDRTKLRRIVNEQKVYFFSFGSNSFNASHHRSINSARC